MAKENTKARIIAEGARIVREKGFNNTGIQEILQAAEVPKGSFYFYFASKEEFGLHLIDHHMALTRKWMAKYLEAAGLAPLASMKAFFDDVIHYFEAQGCQAGCPVGNIAQEMADLSEAFRAKVKEAFIEMRNALARCLEAARLCGEIDPRTDPYETADFILNSWEGALLRMKAQKDVQPLTLFDRMIFGVLLRR